MKKYHLVKDLHFDGDDLIITIDDKITKFRLSDVSPALVHASAEARNTYEISPSGYGVHWPLIDEDLSIDGLLGISHSPKKISAPTNVSQK